MKKTTPVLCYPQLGNYDLAIGYFVRHGLGSRYLAPPAMTKRTIELGAKYSPDYVCAPFKCMMGCYIEALEKGANVLIQTGGTCRLGYYGELHEKILKDLGYDFRIMNLTLQRHRNIPGLLKAVKAFSPDASYPRMLQAIPATFQMIRAIDRVEDYMRRNMGFEDRDGSFEKAHKIFLHRMAQTDSLSEVHEVFRRTMNTMRRLPRHKPKDPVRIGVIGEYFTIMDPYSNHEIEKKLAKMGAEIHRWMNLSNSVAVCPDEKTSRKILDWMRYDLHHFPSSLWVESQKKTVSKYVRYDTGASGISTIALADHYARQGFDGLVHVKSFGCMPEMDVIPILHNISADYKIPILYMSYDTQTSDTGIETRLEAFYDMIAMRKEKR